MAAGAAGFVLVVLALLVLWLRYDALPNADRFRPRIVASIEQASGMAVSVRSMRGGWGGLRPVLTLEGVEISDRAGRAAFQLHRAEATLSWWSLLRGELRFHDVDFYRPQLELRRGADGLIYLADKPLNQAGPGDDGAFTEWLLAQPRLGIHDAALTWRDDFAGAPEVRLTQVQIAVERRRGRHRAALTAVPPRDLAARIDLRADVRLTRQGDAWRAIGEAFMESVDADLGRLRAHLPVPDTLRSGVGSLRLWARFDPQGVNEVVADLAVRDARAQLAADALPLELAALSGRATYRADGPGFTLETEGLRFRLADGIEVRPGRFSLKRTAVAGGPPRIAVRADGIDLKIAATLLDYFPVPREVKNQVLGFAPRGRIADASIAWSDDGARTYSVSGRFEDLALNAVGAMPGLQGLSGVVEGTEAGGTLRIAGRKAVIDAARLFRAPLQFDEIDLRARWRHAGRATEVTVEDARFANADFEGRFEGTWHSLPDASHASPGFVDIKGSLSRANAARVADYMPNRLAQTRDWLAGAMLEGSSPSARFELEGDLWEFPFGGESKGRFLVEGGLSGARLRYHPDWPSVDAIDGSFRFENRRMEIRGEKAAIFASRVANAVAVIDDFSASPPLLTIDGDVDTSGADSMRFLRESPLVRGPGAFTRAVSIEGPARLKLHLEFPLRSAEPARVAGDYAFNGATASVAGKLAIRELRGRLAFTERGVRAPELSGRLFGHPARLALASQPDGRVLTTLDGRISAESLSDYAPRAIASRASGAASWQARIVSDARSTELTVASDLQGLAIDLPAPMGKAAEDKREARLQVANLGGPREAVGASLAPSAFARFARAGDPASPLWNAVVRFGSPPGPEPLREGLWLQGELPALDVDAWKAVFAASAADAGTEGGAPAIELRGLDLSLASVRFLGREFHGMSAALSRSGAQWAGRLESPLVMGEVRWNPQGRGHVYARLDRLAIPEPVARPDAAVPPAAASELPALEVTAERFDFKGRTLGRLTLAASGEGEDWRIDKLDIDAGHAALRSTGLFRRTGAGALTTLNLKLEADNLNALFAQFGYGDYVKRGKGHLEGLLAWPGWPNEFALGQLSGSFRIEARGGQFARIEPGAGKLLGLLSLQSLPRRALFDFRDVFSEGFAFERIQGDVKVARGVLLTEDLEISGPSAFVSLAGEVSLPQETQSLAMRVVPEVGEGMALAATLFGTPVLGLSTLLVSKLLKNPFGKVVAYEYLVTGSWDNPVVTRTSLPPARSAANPAPASTP